MPITAKDAIRLIGRSDRVSDEARLDVFEFLAQSFLADPAYRRLPGS